MPKLSPSQTIKLAQKVYGVQDERVKELEFIFQQTQQDIINQITYFISQDYNWQTKAPKSERDKLMTQLIRMLDNSDDDDRSLIQTAFKGQKSKSRGDLLLANITISLVGLGLMRKKHFVDSISYIPKVINAPNYQASIKIVDKQPDNRSEEEIKTLPSAEIDQTLKQMAHNAVIDRDFLEDNYATINKQTIQTINKVRVVAVKAARSTEPQLNFQKEIALILTGGNKKTNGQMGRAAGMIRTATSQAINRQKQHDYSNRKVKKYRFLSLEGKRLPGQKSITNTCDFCAALDGQIFNLEDAQEGVNYPPIHLNCQCDTEEVVEERYVTGQIDVSDELNKLEHEVHGD